MIERNEREPLRVGLISLGCAKNLVDAEIMLGTLLKDGVQITNDAAKADVMIVNTCSFIDSAQEESVDTILESNEVREARRRGQGLVVSGCLPQRFREELPKLFPEVDAFMGVDQVAQVTDIVRKALIRRTERMKRTTSGTPKSKAEIGERLAEAEKSRAVNQPPGVNVTPNLSAKASARKAGTVHSNEARKGDQPVGPLLAVNSRPTYIPDYSTPRFRLTPRHFAYLKIAEGCNHPCSFCIIPRMRGSHRSRLQSDILEEARLLIADGAKELNLISQDSTYYGMDLRMNATRAISSPDKFGSAVKSLTSDAQTICTLIRELNALPGDFWIRLLYTHPAHWTDELIRTIAECPKVARYVDIPLQHIHENMLERMRRETSQQYIIDLIRRIRAGIPGIALRTTFIVGFPGETETCFRTLLDFIHETKFERLGVFSYSRERGTRAGSMAGHIRANVKRHRRELAMAAQHAVARQVSESFLGRTIKVLVEGHAGSNQLQRANVSSWEHGFLRDSDAVVPQTGNLGYMVARGEADAPDIDGRVYIRGEPAPGEFAKARIVGHTDYDLIGVEA